MVRCIGWLGLDDTDGLSGGCTTHVMHRLVEELDELAESGAGWGPSSDARLVRLWPFAVRRTRGNAAVAVQIPCPRESLATLHRELDRLWDELVIPEVTAHGAAAESSHSERSQSAASPAMVWTDVEFDEDWYWQAVRSEVSLEAVRQTISATEGTRVWSASGGHGVIGAVAAIAWPGGPRHTWEVTSYRLPDNVGSDRMVPGSKVGQMELEFPSTFLSRDPRRSHSLIAPRTPCPVLFGIRATEAQEAVEACQWLLDQDDVEACSGVRLWRTNQATDDHLSGIESDQVSQAPEIFRRGHVKVRLKRGEDLMAFEQGGPVRLLAQSLRKGDRISSMGLISPDGTRHLERLRIDSRGPAHRSRPRCDCGRRFKSKGRGQKLACPGCGERIEAIWEIEDDGMVGQWVEPEASFRRHLLRPLSMNRDT